MAFENIKRNFQSKGRRRQLYNKLNIVSHYSIYKCYQNPYKGNPEVGSCNEVMKAMWHQKGNKEIKTKGFIKNWDFRKGLKKYKKKISINHLYNEN